MRHRLIPYFLIGIFVWFLLRELFGHGLGLRSGAIPLVNMVCLGLVWAIYRLSRR